LIALDLYLHLGQEWLHALYIVMATLFALHLATTRGLNIDELDKSLQLAHQEAIRLKQTNTRLQKDADELAQTNTNLSQTNTDLEYTLSNYKEIMIEKLATQTKLTSNEIVAVVGGDRTKLLQKIKQYRSTSESAETAE